MEHRNKISVYFQTCLKNLVHFQNSVFACKKVSVSSPILLVFVCSLLQGWCVSFATPRHSPRHNSFSSTESSSMCESPPLKQPRLFTPPPPSPAQKQQRHPLNSPLNFELSPTPRNPTSAPFTDSTNRNGDIMITSPPRLERLQLFDYPATPQTLARGSNILAKDSIFNRSVYF